MGTLYIRSNKLLRMFSNCTADVKMELLRSYCSSLYCCSLWSNYRKASYRNLTAAFNNVHRRMLNLPWRCSASLMYVNYNLPNFDTVIRRACWIYSTTIYKSKFNYTCFRALLAHV